MYPNLKGEMSKYNKTLDDLAKATGRTLGTVSLKLNGRYDLTLKECKLIKKAIGTKLTLEELFSEEAI